MQPKTWGDRNREEKREEKKEVEHAQKIFMYKVAVVIALFALLHSFIMSL